MFASDKHTLNSSVLVNEVSHAVRLGVSFSIVFFSGEVPAQRLERCAASLAVLVSLL